MTGFFFRKKIACLRNTGSDDIESKSVEQSRLVGNLLQLQAITVHCMCLGLYAYIYACIDHLDTTVHVCLEGNVHKHNCKPT